MRTLLTFTGLALAATMTVIAATAPNKAADPGTTQNLPVSPTQPLSLFVYSMKIEKQGGLVRGIVEIKGDIMKDNGKIEAKKAIEAASVTVNWLTPAGPAGPTSMSTDKDGKATFTVPFQKGSYTLTVASVSKAGYTYNSSANKDTTITKSIN